MTDWPSYLRTYHARNPAITERVLAASVHPRAGTPYDWLVEALPDKPGVVLDLACGSAPVHDRLSGARVYVGVDLSPEELREASRSGRGALARADAMRLPLATGSVDAVVCSMAVMLMQPLEHALAEVGRVLRPGGVFAAIRPVGWPALPRDARLVLPLVRGLRGGPQMPQRFVPGRFRRSLAAAGLPVADDRALRFSHPLETVDDAHMAVRALYLPDVPEARKAEAARLLSRQAAPGRDLPVSIRRTVARRSTLDVRSSP